MSWTRRASYPLPMGDTYVVSQKGKLLHGVRHKKTGEVGTAVCLTHALWIVEEYYQLAVQVDRECLRGLNPYLSAEAARKYRDGDH